MKHYYAFFHQTKEAIEVEFPDIQGCLTFGDTWEEAYQMAIDALAGCLSVREIYPKASTYEELNGAQPGELKPVPVLQEAIEKYEPAKRFNVYFPANVLTLVDEYRGKRGLKRSELLKEAALEYIQNH